MTKRIEAASDGTADATAAIQAAIDAVYGAGGGIVWMREGTYRIESIISLPKHVRLYGVRSVCP